MKPLKLKTKSSKLKTKIKKGPKKWWRRTGGEGEVDVRLTLTKGRFVLKKPTDDDFGEEKVMKVLAGRRKVGDCFDGYDWNLRLEGKDKTGVKMENLMGMTDFFAFPSI